MISTHPIRLIQALVLAAVVAAFAAPTAVFGATNPGKPAPDWFERYAAAHPFGHGVPGSTAAPDVFERYAATHAPTVLIDGRSPDTRDAAEAARLQRAGGGSPETLTVASGAQPTELVQPGGFDWGDAGIGAIVAVMMIALLGGARQLLARSQRRQGVQAT